MHEEQTPDDEANSEADAALQEWLDRAKWGRGPWL